MSDDGTRILIRRIGGLHSWSNTVDRTARTEPARSAGPGSIEYHLARLDPVKFADATDVQKLAAAGSAKKEYFARIALASAKSRRKRQPLDAA